jgi:uncharacterized protein
MTAKREPKVERAAAVVEPGAQSAGAFSPWLAETRKVARLRTIDADVPCGSCTGCCRASYFIHIRPHEHRALARIPRALLFAAPGAPPGHVLMGYDDHGRCPMLIDDRCSIYEDRPQTCREFDCRVFAATGIALDEEGPQAGIAVQVRRWRFELGSARARGELAAVRAAATFLQERRELFAPGQLPPNPAQLAAVAIQVVDVFLERGAPAGGKKPARRSDAEIARAVTDELARLRLAAASASQAVPVTPPKPSKPAKPTRAAKPARPRPGRR